MSWFNPEHTVLLVTYNEDHWTWEDIFAALKEQYAMIESVPHSKVDVIVDVRKSNWLPRGGSLLTPIRKFMGELHPRQGKTLFVGAHGMVASILGVLGTMMGPKRSELIFVKTMDDVPPRLAQIAAQRQQDAKKTPRPSS